MVATPSDRSEVVRQDLSKLQSLRRRTDDPSEARLLDSLIGPAEAVVAREREVQQLERRLAVLQQRQTPEAQRRSAEQVDLLRRRRERQGQLAYQTRRRDSEGRQEAAQYAAELEANHEARAERDAEELANVQAGRSPPGTRW